MALNHTAHCSSLQRSHQAPSHPPSLRVIRQVEWILGVCACFSTQPSFPLVLQDSCRAFNEWDSLLVLAEYHGLAPLLHSGLASAPNFVPTEIRRALKGLFLRHRHANAVRGRVLAEILQAYESAAIDVLVLKGAALAPLVYPSPGLRPMRDLDLLVREPDKHRAQQTLSDLGFDISPDPSHALPSRHQHMEVARRLEEGLNISVEVHFRLYPKWFYYPATGFEDLYHASIPFRVESVTARTLGSEDMLGHVVRHALGPPLWGTPLRFIHLSDIIRLVDTFGSRINRSKLVRRYPRVARILPLLNVSIPRHRGDLRVLPYAETKIWRGMFHDFQGWPRMPLSMLGGKKQSFKETLFPEEWWVRLFYGAGTHGYWLWHRWIQHPLHVFKLYADSMLRKHPTPHREE